MGQILVKKEQDTAAATTTTTTTVDDKVNTQESNTTEEKSDTAAATTTTTTTTTTVDDKVNTQESNTTEEKINEVDDYLKTWTIPCTSLEQLITYFHENFNCGLLPADSDGKERGTIAMLPTYVRDIPNGTEDGDYFALDLGGTNFRVLLVQIHDRKITTSHESYPVSETLMKGKGEDLFDFIAQKLAEFAKEKLGSDVTTISAVGFTFSFPVEQKSLYSGTLIRWTKGYSADNVEGEDIVALLEQAIDKRKEIKVEKIVLINDTTGVMMCGAFEDPNVAIGLILGTGTNACYMEELEKVNKWDGDSGEPKQVIINTEWGAFGDKGDLASVQTESDLLIDNNSINKGQQIFEKMISGMYLGCVAQQCMIHLVNKSLLLGGELTPQLGKYNNFDTKYVSQICSDSASACVEILSSFGYEKVTISDCVIIRNICNVVSTRAARLAAAGLAALIRRINRNPVTVAVDGTLFKKHPTFKQFMEDALKELLPTYDVKLMLAEDGSGVGAALAAAVAKRLGSS